MKLEQSDLSLLFSSTNLPDIFFTEYLSQISGDALKVYLYMTFLAKYNKDIRLNDLSKKLELPLKTIQDSIKYLEEQTLITRKNTGYILNNIQEIELHKLYNPKVTSSPEELEKISQNKHRAKAIDSINNQFFQGIMSPSWYIKTYNDLDKYYQKQEKLNTLQKTISKKLGLTRHLSQYEEGYIEKWNIDYGYNLDIIELALKKTTSKANPNFDYLDKLLTDWHDRNFKTTNDVQNFLLQMKEKNKNIKTLEKNTGYSNYDQRNYNDLNNFYANNTKLDN